MHCTLKSECICARCTCHSQFFLGCSKAEKKCEDWGWWLIQFFSRSLLSFQCWCQCDGFSSLSLSSILPTLLLSFKSERVRRVSREMSLTGSKTQNIYFFLCLCKYSVNILNTKRMPCQPLFTLLFLFSFSYVPKIRDTY